MKRQILLLVAFLFAVASYAQETTFVKGEKVLNLGIGLGSTLYSGSYYNSKIPPISVSLEYGVVDDLLDVAGLNVGVGGYIGYSSYKWETNWLGTPYGWNLNSIVIGVRGAVHYPVVDKLDTYAGLMFGPNIVSSKEFGDWTGAGNYNAASTSFFSAYYIGGRYYFKDNFSVMAELGYGISYLNIGVSFKL
jgi:hypothetical protein